jgi:hypothetical protein
VRQKIPIDRVSFDVIPQGLQPPCIQIRKLMAGCVPEIVEMSVNFRCQMGDVRAPVIQHFLFDIPTNDPIGVAAPVAGKAFDLSLGKKLADYMVVSEKLP